MACIEIIIYLKDIYHLFVVYEAGQMPYHIVNYFSSWIYFLKICAHFPGIPIDNIGSHFLHQGVSFWLGVSACWAEWGMMNSLLYVLPAESWNASQRLGNGALIRSIWLFYPAEETWNSHIGWTGSQQLSASPEPSRLQSTGSPWMVSDSQVEICWDKYRLGTKVKV